jgi:hypothetical protein
VALGVASVRHRDRRRAHLRPLGDLRDAEIPERARGEHRAMVIHRTRDQRRPVGGARGLERGRQLVERRDVEPARAEAPRVGRVIDGERRAVRVVAELRSQARPAGAPLQSVDRLVTASAGSRRSPA